MCDDGGGGGLESSSWCGYSFSSPVPRSKRPGVRSRSPQPRSLRVVGRIDDLLLRRRLAAVEEKKNSAGCRQYDSSISF